MKLSEMNLKKPFACIGTMFIEIMEKKTFFRVLENILPIRQQPAFGVGKETSN